MKKIAQLFKSAPSSRADFIREQLMDVSSPRVFVVGHRGDWRNAPENSFEAVMRACEMGVDIVEIDVRQTKDDHLVLMHDRTIDRTTSGKGYVCDYTLEELSGFVLKDGLGHATGHRIPCLRDVLIATKGKILINLDKLDQKSIPIAMDLARETGILEYVIFKNECSYEKAEDCYGHSLKEIIYMPVISDEKPESKDFYRDYEKHLDPLMYEFTFTTFPNETTEIMRQLYKKGSRIWVNSLWPHMCAGHHDDQALIDPEATWGWLLKQGVSLLQTDRPAEMLDYLRRKGLHD